MTKEERKIYNKLYYLKKQEQRKIYNKEHRLKNKEHIKKQRKEYRLKNKEHLLKEKAEYYQKNKEYIKEKRKEYVKNNPDKINERAARRRAKKKAVTAENANKNIIKTFYKMSSRLSECLGIPFHVDHLIPLNINGIHHEENLLPVPASVNISRKKDEIDLSHPFYSHLDF